MWVPVTVFTPRLLSWNSPFSEIKICLAKSVKKQHPVHLQSTITCLQFLNHSNWFVQRAVRWSNVLSMLTFSDAQPINGPITLPHNSIGLSHVATCWMFLVHVVGCWFPWASVIFRENNIDLAPNSEIIQTCVYRLLRAEDKRNVDFFSPSLKKHFSASIFHIKHESPLCPFHGTNHSMMFIFLFFWQVSLSVCFLCTWER